MEENIFVELISKTASWKKEVEVRHYSKPTVGISYKGLKTNIYDVNQSVNIQTNIDIFQKVPKEITECRHDGT